MNQGYSANGQVPIRGSQEAAHRVESVGVHDRLVTLGPHGLGANSRSPEERRWRRDDGIFDNSVNADGQLPFRRGTKENSK